MVGNGVCSKFFKAVQGQAVSSNTVLKVHGTRITFVSLLCFPLLQAVGRQPGLQCPCKSIQVP